MIPEETWNMSYVNSLPYSFDCAPIVIVLTLFLVHAGKDITDAVVLNDFTDLVELEALNILFSLHGSQNTIVQNINFRCGREVQEVK